MKEFSLNDFAKSLENKPKYESKKIIELKNRQPEIVSRFTNEWDNWLKNLNSERGKIVHECINKEAFIDGRFFRNTDEDSQYVRTRILGGLNTKEKEFVNKTYNKLFNFTSWALHYLENSKKTK